MIIISSLNAAEAAFERYTPSFVISILDNDDPAPEVFRELPAERHLTLNAMACPGENCDEAKWCADILRMAGSWAASGENILIHCHRGVARSTAIAYILMCVKEEKTCEHQIAERLRKAAPHADPNLLLVSTADTTLGRDDRMVSAMLDMCPSCATVAAPIVTLPLAS